MKGIPWNEHSKNKGKCLQEVNTWIIRLFAGLKTRIIKGCWNGNNISLGLAELASRPWTARFLLCYSFCISFSLSTTETWHGLSDELRKKKDYRKQGRMEMI
jgi:hypothetical protein